MTSPQFVGRPFGTTIAEETLCNTFIPLTQWEDEYRQLILLGKRLPTLPDVLKAQAEKIAGCESRVWLGHTLHENGTLHFFGDNEDRIVRELSAILPTVVKGKTAARLLARAPMVLFGELGLRAQLSVPRNQGMHTLNEAIPEAAQKAG